MKRVFIITDQLVVGQGIIDTIRRTPGLELVGSIGSRVSVPAMARQLAPDICAGRPLRTDQPGARAAHRGRAARSRRQAHPADQSACDKAWFDSAFEAGAQVGHLRDVRPAHLGILLLELAENRVALRPSRLRLRRPDRRDRR